MPERIVLDPTEVATGRTQVDVTDWVSSEGIDWGDAEIAAYMAEQERGSTPVDFRVPNRQITVPLKLQPRGTFTFEQARQTVQAKAALFQREGGWLKRITAGGGTVFADVVNATLKLGGSWLQAHRGADTDASLSLEAIPDWYGAEIDLGDNTETTLPELVFQETGVKGDYPGRVRIVVDEDDADSQLGLMWGIRSRHYSSATTAALAYQAEQLTPQDAAAGTALAGASGGTAVRHNSLATGWTPVLSTDLAGTGPLTHTGTYRVVVRAYSTSATPPQARLVWDVGDLTHPGDNSPVALAGTAAFYTLDLGEVRLDPAPVGTHRWFGLIEAKGATGGENIWLDRVWFVPVDEGYGVLRASEGLVNPLGPRTAGTAVDDATVGTIAWLNPNGATAIGGAYAESELTDGSVKTGHYLKATNFGFAVPTSASIKGIVVEVMRESGPQYPGPPYDNAVRIVKGGAIQSTDRSSSVPYALPAAYLSYGSTTDLWGATWTPADINASTFGVAISPRAPSSSGAEAVIDHIQITIYYEFGGADAVIYASQSAELRTDGMFREDSTGVGYGPVSNVVGSLPRIPPSGLEARTVQFFLKGSRGDFDTKPDSGIDNISARVFYRPSWLIVPV